jgi:protein phosphatase
MAKFIKKILGATGDTGKYSITGDAYSFDMLGRYWKKIEGI